MLTRLSIRHFLLIEQLDFEPHSGLTALTGETGAGKSILFNALGLTVGDRANSDLIRSGADHASITSTWQLPDTHSVWHSLDEMGLVYSHDEPLVLRRILKPDSSKGFVNDQAVSSGYLKTLGSYLVEIQGQFAQHSLLNPQNHLAVLDTALDKDDMACLGLTAEAWRRLRESRKIHAQQQEDISQLEAEREYLEHNVIELRQLAPEIGEDQQLAMQRLRLQHRDSLLEGLGKALDTLQGEQSAEDQTHKAAAILARLDAQGGDGLTAAITALDHALSHLAESADAVRDLVYVTKEDDTHPDEIEERLFALREAARKHKVEADELPSVLTTMEAQLNTLDTSRQTLEASAQELQAATDNYHRQAQALSQARTKAARRLEQQTTRELPDLKLAKARLHIGITSLPDNKWGERGCDAIQFEVQTHPDLPSGPLHKVASGGELSRLMLAMKMALSGAENGVTLVFDEVDAGIGGATAAAVGQRLQTLAQRQQILVVTHSPQVAAASDQQWHVSKNDDHPGTLTNIQQLDETTRLEELARMLSGSDITTPGREAAAALLVSARKTP